jgi:23S rRNA (cytidine1920-2'-O)/16S rRNA (cytidine1409-2'-O)-methyltransferase
VPRRQRLDAELVRRGLARSREHAGDLIAQGRVSVGGTAATKAASAVSTDVALVVTADPDRPEYVSRGGHKLAGALQRFGPDGLRTHGRQALDAGASTGGFTDVLLRNEVAHVLAVDVGYGQLAWPLRQDPRVTVVDRTNVRDLRREQLPYAPDLVVADLSFISLSMVLPALAAVSRVDADLVLMVKPQFEVGRGRLGAGGVVRDPALRTESVLSVATAGRTLGLGVRGVCASPLPGPAGNVEYFIWFRRGAPDVVVTDVETVVAEGPQ